MGILTGYTASSQSDPADPQKLKIITPPAPDASALGKYGDLPVGLFTGTPQISIPLWQINEGEVNIPVSLNYHASGIKVGEIASSVGLSWSLNAGGVVTRSVRGKPDESTAGYLQRDAMLSPLTVPMQAITSQTLYSKYEAVAYGNIDMEPDIFVFNFLGKTGKFFFDHTGAIHAQPYDNLIIQLAGDFSSCTITDEIGIKYIFGSGEETTSSTNLPNDDPQTFISSWYLTNVIYPNGKTVSFTYSSPVSIAQQQFTSQTDYFLINYNYPFPLLGFEECYECERLPAASYVLSSQSVNAVKLTSIVSDNTRIVFVSDTVHREDLSGDYALKSIKIYSRADSQLVKQYNLSHSYFGSGTENEKRLKLDKVTEFSSTLDSLRPHQFFYEESVQLPARNSYAQDHWGYYNGAYTNTTMLPHLAGQPTGLQSGNRESDSVYMLAGSLKRIQYPTGGSTNFLFESNKVVTIYTSSTYLTVSLQRVNGFPATYDSASFTIANAQECNYLYQAYSGGYPIEDTVPTMTLTRNDTVIRFHSGDGNLSSSVWLTPGTYKLKIGTPDVPESNVIAELYYLSAPTTDTIVRPVGGLRILKMIDSAGTNPPVVKRFEYETPVFTGPGIDNEAYRFNNIRRVFDQCEDAPPVYVQPEAKCYYFGRGSSVSHVLGSIQGGHIGYGKVKTIYGQNGENGKSESYFHADAPVTYGTFPPIPSLDFEWRNGLLETQNDFNAQGTLVRKLLNSYEFTGKYADTSFKAGFLYDNTLYDATSEWPLYTNTDQITHNYFPIVVEQVKKTGSVEMIYADGDSIATGTGYYYDNADYNFPTRVSNSSGITISAYPQDYSPGTPFIDSMVAKHIIGVPIESVTYKEDAGGSNKRIVKGVITKFKTLPIVADTVFVLQSDTAIAQSDFKFSNRSSGTLPPSGSISGFSKDSRYTPRVVFEGYDTKTNLRQQRVVNNVKQSYIWDYNFAYPVAEVINADTASIAFTSFEADSKGGWTYGGGVSGSYALTGSKSYLNSGGNITRSGLTSTTYIVSYWGRNGSVNVNSAGPARTGKTIGDWTYYEHEVTTTSVTVSDPGSHYIDELRLYPKGAQMTSYTYKRLVGLTSKCDATNRIVKYEYDSFNRLKLVKDEDGRILKRVDYKYQGTFQQ